MAYLDRSWKSGRQSLQFVDNWYCDGRRPIDKVWLSRRGHETKKRASGLPEDESAVGDLRDEEDRKRDACTTLFNESQSRIVISVAPEDVEKTMSTLREDGVPFRLLGKVGGNDLRIRVNDETFRWPVSDLYDDWFNAIRRAVEDETERVPSL